MVNILSFADYLVSVWTIQPCHCNVGSYISYANKWALLCSNKRLFTKTCSKDLAGWPLSASFHHYPQKLYPSPCKSLEKQMFDFIQLVYKQRYIVFDEVVIKCSTNLGMSYIVSVKVPEKAMPPTPVLLPGKSHGRRSLVGCNSWGHYELDTTERLHFHFSLSCIGKEMATHSSVLAWRIPGAGEPDGLPSMGSHRVGHD